MPYVIATSSIELQNAVLNDYIPKLSDILLKERIISKPLTAVLRKGKHNYICDKKLLSYIRDIQGSSNSESCINALVKLSMNCETDLDNVTTISTYDKKRIRVNQCPKNCDHKHNCLYSSIHEENLNPNIMFQVCNHNYYVADLKHKRNGMKNLLPCYRGVIIDEAHKFEDVLNEMYKKKLKKNDMLMTLGRIKSKFNKTSHYDEACDIIIQAKKHINLLYNSFYKQIDSEERTENTQFAIKIYPYHIKRIKLIAACFTKLEYILKERFLVDYPYKSAISELKEIMVSFVCSKINVYWIGNNDFGFFDTLYSLPLGINKTYQHQIWTRSIPVILTSGTLSINNNFNYVRRKLGLEIIADHKYDDTIKKSPFDYSSNCLIYFPNITVSPKHRDEIYIKTLAKQIEEITTATKGRSLVLFTSYTVMNKVYDIVKDKLKYPLIMSERKNRNAVEQFKQTTDGILFSTDAWEGIDVEGELLSSLIIAKLPFPIPNIGRKQILSEYGDFKTYMQSEIIPNMQIKLKQGAGRLIRSETDRGVICILDNRYHDETLAALPTCRTTTEINDVSDFLNQPIMLDATYQL